MPEASSRTVASIGGPSIFEDFDTYPRTFERDCNLLRAAGCNLVFAPSEAELYPESQVFKVEPPAELANILEGHFRSGFFTGVCTVVLKLFNCVQPRVGGVRQEGLPAADGDSPTQTE